MATATPRHGTVPTRSRRGLRGARLVWLLLALVVVVGAYLLSLGAAYEVGLAQTRTETERLLEDLRQERERGRALELEVERNRERARATTEQLSLVEERARGLPALSPGLREVLPAIDARLRAGMAPERLARIVGHAPIEQRCQPLSELRRLQLGLPETPAGAVSAAAGEVQVRAFGTPAAEGGRVDPAGAVTFEILRGDARIGRASGELPLRARILAERQEFLLEAAADPRRGYVQLSLRVCDFP